MLIRMVADLIVTNVTTVWWMQNKTVDKERHDHEGGVQIAEMYTPSENEQSELLKT